jgi:competence protein ComEC
MIKIHKYPFLKYTVYTVAGIIFYYYCKPPILFIIISVMVLYATALCLHLYKRYSKHKTIIRTACLALLFICLGITMAYWKLRPYNAALINACTNATYSKVVVLETPVEKPNSYKLVVQLYECVNDSVAFNTDANALLYVDKAAYNSGINIGTHLQLMNTWQVIKGTGNPGAFNYHRYCLFNSIYFQSYVNQNGYKVLNKKDNFWFSNIVNQCKQQIIRNIKNLISDTANSGIANALLIGYRDDLDKDIVQAYSNTGVIHVIAISGLHIGFLYLLLRLLLSTVFRGRRFLILSHILQLLSIWLFVILTGASSSVVRSGIMFSIIILGNILQKEPNIINSICVAVFIQLFINPFSLWDVGFQLSYAAVLSIVLFYNPIYKLVATQYKLLNYVLKMGAVTLSAQVLTLPIILYTFHQFPNYFLLANLIIVPLSNIILFGLLLLLCINTISHFAAVKLGILVNKCISLANNIVLFFNNLPYATTNNIIINFWQAVLIATVAILVYVYITSKKGIALKLACIGVLLVAIIHLFNKYEQHNTSTLMVLNIPKQSFIGLLHNNTIKVYADSMLQHTNPATNFYIKPSLIYYGNPIVNIVNSNALEVTTYKNYTVLIAKNTQKVISATLPANKNYIFINIHNSQLYESVLPKLPKGSYVIADQSNTAKTVHAMQEVSNKLGLRFYSTYDHGAFILKD